MRGVKDRVLILTMAEVLRELGEDGAHCFDSPQDRVSIAERFAFELDLYPPAVFREFVEAAVIPGDIDFAAEEEAYCNANGEETEADND